VAFCCSPSERSRGPRRHRSINSAHRSSSRTSRQSANGGQAPLGHVALRTRWSSPTLAPRPIATSQPAPDGPRPGCAGHERADRVGRRDVGGRTAGTHSPTRAALHARRSSSTSCFTGSSSVKRGLTASEECERTPRRHGRTVLAAARMPRARTGPSGVGRHAHRRVRDALAFRRRGAGFYPGSAEKERALEINEGSRRVHGTAARGGFRDRRDRPCDRDTDQCGDR
jgi:hypothetical protein